jgi:hypothetical protein
MGKITFKKSKPYKGVDYSKNEKHIYSYYWQFKHQVPVLSELPNEYIKWAYLRFPYKLKQLPDDSGDYYDFIKFEPIKKGDVIYNYGYYIGVVSEIKVSGDKENGYYIEIVYDRVFKEINKERVLVDEIRTDKLDMRNLLWFYYGLIVYKLSEIKYVETSGIVPHYQNIIKEQDVLIKKLTSEINEYKKILGNIDNRIKQVSYDEYQRLEDFKKPKPIPKRELSDSERRRIQESEWESTHNVAEGLRQLKLDRDAYDSWPWLDKWCGKRP